MDSLRKALVAVAVLGTGAGVGTTLFALVVPGELQKQAMLQEMPERDSRRRDEAVRTKELVMATLKKAAATEENVTWRKNWLGAVNKGSRSA
ncbi:ubiquinol-cytochrome-c reductase complex assembly factor 3 [Phodopus roborovskii]|uniref:Ubiquinol-cytochrome-c reductase complex assembly factor 3 n=1 Tax=Phodopus roborovskii TaxID=109678 RepID=A0AAU9ZQY0_PHORO|nr:ubiquinol-cytochrome-c reductase complex assembly factor 3 [Phodopus roborovskii]CAH6793695.1 Uqcc3 [Phodopus roborovskii]